MCVFMCALAWGQAAPGNAPAKDKDDDAKPAMQQQKPGDKDDAEAKKPEPKEVPETAVVLTIKGVCPAGAGAATAKTAAAKSETGKTAAGPKAGCVTKITKAQFEKIANGLSTNVTPQLKRQLEQALPRFMAMSDIAKKQGLENDPHVVQTLKIAKMQILTQELQRKAQEKADQVPATEVEKYYKDNPEAYEQFSLDRLFIPRYKTLAQDEKTEDRDDAKDEKQTDEQQKAKEAEEKEKQEKGEQELNKLADELRDRAAKGEDFTKLQKDAFEAAGTKVENPTVNLPKVRRTGLPPAHSAVFDLKVGDVSQVISDNGGHYIYKVVSKDELPLDQVKDEIHNKLKSERLKESMDKYNASYTVEPNEDYFGPPQPQGAPPRRPGMGMGGRPMPMTPPRGGAPAGNPPQAAPPSSAPAQPAPPPSK